jgi:hypothetical protein
VEKIVFFQQKSGLSNHPAPIQIEIIGYIHTFVVGLSVT